VRRGDVDSGIGTTGSCARTQSRQLFARERNALARSRGVRPALRTVRDKASGETCLLSARQRRAQTEGGGHDDAGGLGAAEARQARGRRHARRSSRRSREHVRAVASSRRGRQRRPAHPVGRDVYSLLLRLRRGAQRPRRARRRSAAPAPRARSSRRAQLQAQRGARRHRHGVTQPCEPNAFGARARVCRTTSSPDNGESNEAPSQLAHGPAVHERAARCGAAGG